MFNELIINGNKFINEIFFGRSLMIIVAIWCVFCIQKRIRFLVFARWGLMAATFIFLLVEHHFKLTGMIKTWMIIWFPLWLKYMVVTVLAIGGIHYGGWVHSLGKKDR